MLIGEVTLTAIFQILSNSEFQIFLFLSVIGYTYKVSNINTRKKCLKLKSFFQFNLEVEEGTLKALVPDNSVLLFHNTVPVTFI